MLLTSIYGVCGMKNEEYININEVATVQEVIKYIDCWIKYHNSKPCPNDSSKTIQEILNGVERQDIDKNILNDLMMKTETRTINRHGITFLCSYFNRCINFYTCNYGFAFGKIF